MPLAKWPADPNQGLRGIDDFGNGAFGAGRIASNHSAGDHKPGTSYAHKGLDIAIPAGGIIYSPCAGTLLWPGFAYKNMEGDLRSIHIVGSGEFKNYRFTILYAKLMPNLRGIESVNAGDPICLAQDIASFEQAKRPGKCRNHIHVEVRRYDPATQKVSLVDPNEVFGVAA